MTSLSNFNLRSAVGAVAALATTAIATLTPIEAKSQSALPATSQPASTTPYFTAPYTVRARDDLAVRQVIARLNHALDAADYKAYGEMFASDGVFVSAFGNAVGPEQVEIALGKVRPFIINRRHVAGNLVITGNAQEIVVTSYLIVFERVAELKYVGSAINIDTLRKVRGRWMVVRHDSTLDPATTTYIQSLMAN